MQATATLAGPDLARRCTAHDSRQAAQGAMNKARTASTEGYLGCVARQPQLAVHSLTVHAAGTAAATAAAERQQHIVQSDSKCV
jgi:hypothetical protein